MIKEKYKRAFGKTLHAIPMLFFCFLLLFDLNYIMKLFKVDVIKQW